MRSQIGALASPEQIQFVSELPKTLSGKTVRRILRKIASGDNLESLGDTTTLAHPEVLEDIYNNYLKLKVGQPEK